LFNSQENSDINIINSSFEHNFGQGEGSIARGGYQKSKITFINSSFIENSAF